MYLVPITYDYEKITHHKRSYCHTCTKAKYSPQDTKIQRSNE